jgi:tetratricopeptide (TPR) repeat protein
MRRATLTLALLALAFALQTPPPAFAVMELATVRGKVVDQDGNGVPDVKIVFDFTGESRVKISKEVVSDKKGGFVRAGLTAGPYKISFTKEGYRTHIREMSVSLGGFSEIEPTLMEKLPPAQEAAAAPAGAPGAAAAALPADATAQIKAAYAKAADAAKAGLTDDAIAAYKELIELAPKLGAAHYNLAVLYEGQKNWKAAEAELLATTELDPSQSDAVIALSAVRELDGRGEEAVDGLLKAAPSFDQDAKFQYALGVTCVNTGRNAEAADAFSKVASLDPTNVEVHYWLGTLAVGKNDVPTALAELEKYVSLQGQDPQNLQTAKAILTALKPKK